MAKKKGDKPKRSIRRDSSPPKEASLLPGLGGGPWEPRPKPASRLEMEQVQRTIGKLLAEQDFESEADANAFLASLTGRSFDDILGMAVPNPQEEAQDLAYLAMQATKKSEARSYCREALKLDPHCLDAQMVQAGLDARTPTDLALRMRTIVRDAESHFGPAFMEENRGHFWGLLETRPYMRARQSLVSLLYDAGKLAEAIEECEGLLDLNPNDNQGNRDVLRGLYLEAGNLDGLRRVNTTYDDGDWAIPAWSETLERWLSGDLKQAEKRARAGHKSNPHVVAFLTKAKRLPKEEPDFYSPGDEREAALCGKMLGKAWQSHSDAVAWLRGLKLT